jgi:hypothetical protein
MAVMNPSRAVSILARIESEKDLRGLTPVGALCGGVQEPNIESEVAFIVARYAVAVGRTILKGADGHGRAHLVWLTDRIRIATANQTDRRDFPMHFTHRA